MYRTSATLYITVSGMEISIAAVCVRAGTHYYPELAGRKLRT